MKSAVESLNPTRVKLTVEVPFEELKPSVDAAYKTIAGQVSIPGFRKGKVPPRIIDQRVGKGAVLQEAVNSALPELYAQAVQETDVRPLGQPEVDVTDVPDPTEGGELKFTAEVDIRPQIDLPEYEQVTVTVDDLVVSEEDVDERLEALRERFGTLVTVEKVAAKDDFVSIDISGTVDGEEVDTAKGVSYQIGSGGMLPGMDEALEGLSAGETTSFDAPLAGGERAGQEAHITVVLGAVKERQLPAADDDFAQLASEFDTLEELRADLRTQVEQSKQMEQAMQARERFVEQLLESLQVPVPEGLVEAEVHRHLESESRLEDEEHRAEVSVEARKALQQQLLLDTMAEREQVSVEQQDLVEFLVANAQQYGMEPNAFAQAMDSSGQIPAVVAEIARRKAVTSVLTRITVVDASGNTVDLNALLEEEDGETVADLVGTGQDGDNVEGDVVEGDVVEAGAVEGDVVEAGAQEQDAPTQA